MCPFLPLMLMVTIGVEPVPVCATASATSRVPLPVPSAVSVKEGSVFASKALPPLAARWRPLHFPCFLEDDEAEEAVPVTITLLTDDEREDPIEGDADGRVDPEEDGEEREDPVPVLLLLTFSAPLPEVFEGVGAHVPVTITPLPDDATAPVPDDAREELVPAEDGAAGKSVPEFARMVPLPALDEETPNPDSVTMLAPEEERAPEPVWPPDDRRSAFGKRWMRTAMQASPAMSRMRETTVFRRSRSISVFVRITSV